MIKPGDIVRFLNDVGGGRVTRIEGNIAYVEDEDGFETPVLQRECVVVGSATYPAETSTASKAAPAPQTAPQAAPKAPTSEPELPIEETAEGERINVTLAFEPQDLTKPTSTALDTYLVNDSNYYLTFAYSMRAADGEWQLRYAGTVEPNIQLWLEEITHDDLPQMDRVAVQLVAYKRGKGFALKRPMAVDLPLDTTKFFKLHCFRSHIYFDKPVIALDIVKNDEVVGEKKIDHKRLEQEMNRKKRADRVVRRPVQRKKQVDVNGNIIVDLHIDELVDTTAGMSNADILNLQIDEFRRVMDANLGHKGTKIIFIHGKGEGVLRKALLKELNHRYKGHDVQDASFREYGFGATQVTIR